MNTTKREMLTVTIDAEALEWLKVVVLLYGEMYGTDSGLKRAKEAIDSALPEPSR